MLLHKITYQVKVDVNTPVGVEQHVKTPTKWVGSQSDAASFRKVVRQKFGYIPNSVQTSKINVPTKKEDLIKFLNSSIIR